MGWREQLTGWRRSGWVSLATERDRPPEATPLPRHGHGGVGQRRHPKYARRLLTKGACDGCALGWLGCTTGRSMGSTCARPGSTSSSSTPPTPSTTAASPTSPRSPSARPPSCGRWAGWPTPCAADAARRGFQRVSWDEALGVVAGAIAAAPPDRVALYLTSRGHHQRDVLRGRQAARAMGVASVDSAARVCHAPSTVGLKATIGVAASTCSLQDVIESDLVVLWGPRTRPTTSRSS